MRNSCRQTNVEHTLAQDWELGGSSNNVVISIYDLNDNELDVDAVAMTSETGGLFTYLWTPTEDHTYFVKYNNKDLDVFDYETIIVSSDLSEVLLLSGVTV